MEGRSRRVKETVSITILNEEDEKEIQIIVDAADDKNLLHSITLQHDYIALSEDSEDSSNSSSENSDYSL